MGAEAENPKIYSKEYYRRLFEVEERHWWCRGMRSIAEALLAPYLRAAGTEAARWSVLDAGCGSGVAVNWLRGLGVGGRFAAFDLSAHALEFCRSRGQGGLCVASMLELPYREGSFDLVTCLDVLQHLPLPEGDAAALRECRRVMRPGGLLLARSNARRRADANETREADYQRYTTQILRERIEGAGLEVLRISLVNSLDAWRERLGLVHRREAAMVKSQSDHGLPLRLMPPWMGWLNGALRLWLEAEARALRRPGSELGSGHSTIALARKPAA